MMQTTRDIEAGASDEVGPLPEEAPSLRVSVSDVVLSTPKARLAQGTTLTRQHSDPTRRRQPAKETPAAPPVLFRQFPSLRALSFKVYAPVVETFFCYICMENWAVTDGRSFTGGGECEHRFCQSCLSGYVSTRIVEGQTRHPCPGSDRYCSIEATRDDIEKIVTEDVLAKYDRFLAMQSDENHRDCPNCGTMFVGNPKAPELVCPNCSTTFCFFHSNAHPGQSCREYARRTHRQERDSRTTIVRISKACPQCRTRVEKDGGCNHMSCTCGCQWCWLCGRRMGSNHFSTFNLFGCPGSQFSDMNHNWFMYPYKVLLVLFAIGYCVFVTLMLPLILFIQWKTEKDWEDSVEQAAKVTLLPLLYLLLLVLYLFLYIPLCLVLFIPLYTLWHTIRRGQCPSNACRLLIFKSE